MPPTAGSPACSVLQKDYRSKRNGGADRNGNRKCESDPVHPVSSLGAVNVIRKVNLLRAIHHSKRIGMASSSPDY